MEVGRPGGWEGGGGVQGSQRERGPDSDAIQTHQWSGTSAEPSAPCLDPGSATLPLGSAEVEV